MDILKTPIPQSVLDSIDGYIENKIAPTQFNPNNTASGAGSVTLDTLSGTITYSTFVTSGNPIQFTLNNSLVSVNSKLFWAITYKQKGDEQIIPLTYTCAEGQVIFSVGLYNGTTSDDTFSINFQILN